MSSLLSFRAATAADLSALVAMLADDALGAQREDPTSPAYAEAFAAITGDQRHLLLVATRDGAILGVLQLSFIPGLSHQGAWRAQIEGVRVAASARGEGVGSALVTEAIARARHHGCRIVQLTTDKRREDAQRFYAALGFVASHEGMKLRLDEV